MPVVEGAFPVLLPLPLLSGVLEIELFLVERCTDEYVASFKPELMDAVYSWCNGAKFSEICKVRLPLPLSFPSLSTTLTHLAAAPIRR